VPITFTFEQELAQAVLTHPKIPSKLAMKDAVVGFMLTPQKLCRPYHLAGDL
jgi:hypothetical protein